MSEKQVILKLEMHLVMYLYRNIFIQHISLSTKKKNITKVCMSVTQEVSKISCLISF